MSAGLVSLASKAEPEDRTAAPRHLARMLENAVVMGMDDLTHCRE